MIYFFLQDLAYFKSEDRTETVKREAGETVINIMCSYKLVTVKFESETQTRVEQFVHKVSEWLAVPGLWAQ